MEGTILQLPEKEIKTQFVKLDDEERYFYNYFFNQGRKKFVEILKGGAQKYKYASVFEVLTRLRQVCDHPSLIFSKEELKDKESLEAAMCAFFNKDSRGQKMEQGEEGGNARVHSKFIEETIDRFKNEELEPCPICLGDIEDSVILKCGHIFCKKCLEQVRRVSELCSMCQKKTSDEEMMFINLAESKRFRDLLDIDVPVSKKGSKLIALQESIQEIIERGEKCVVFSQFLGMLDLIQRCIHDMNVKFTRIDGSMTMEKRSKSVISFVQDNEISVILISLKAGAVGLNLTAANNVFLVDPWWNPAIEDQAIERVHRIGQVRKVNVKRSVCKKTIEEKVMELNIVKKEMIKNVLHFDPEEQRKQNIQNMVYIMQGFEEDLKESTGLMDAEKLLSTLSAI